MSSVDLLQLYADRMGEMKARMARIESVLAEHPGLSEKQTSQDDGPALEDFALQFRKVLELIAYSGMIANRKTYEAVHKDFVEHAYPAKIAKRLSSMHPRWFPEHVQLTYHPRQPALAFAQAAASAFTVKYWQTLYDAMGTLLHVSNPFAGRVQVKLDRPVAAAYGMVKRHMRTHRVSVLEGPLILCDLGDVGEHCKVSEGQNFPL